MMVTCRCGFDHSGLVNVGELQFVRRRARRGRGGRADRFWVVIRVNGRQISLGYATNATGMPL
jgi:hypothetical protein